MDALLILVVILLLAWGGGFAFNGYGMGNLVHLLLVIALIVVVIRLARGQRILP